MPTCPIKLLVAALTLLALGAGCDNGTDDDTDGTDVTFDCGSASGTPAADVCTAAEAFASTLSSSQQSTLLNDFTASNADNWSNLPVGMTGRNGLALGDLSDTQREAALDLIQAALSDAGYGTFEGIRAADDYLGENGGGDQYAAGLYYVAFLGTPSATEPWMLQVGGHHYALNFTYDGDTASPTPNFVGVEPLTFTLDGESYAPMAGRAATTTAMLDALSSDQLADARLSGSFNDVLLGPGEDGAFPSPPGLQASTLDDSQRALVADAIEAWVIDAGEDVAAELLAAYTSDDALDETYVGYAGTGDLTSRGDYVRIDGPRVWIEIVAQGGVVLSGIHYHSIWRDQTLDYGGLLF